MMEPRLIDFVELTSSVVIVVNHAGFIAFQF